MCALTSSCVIPPTLDVAESNTPPVFELAGTTPDPREVVDVSQSDPTKPQPNRTRFNVSFRDPDPEPVTLRAFLGFPPYDSFLPGTQVTVGPNSSGLRVGPVDIVGLCDDLVIGGTYFVSIYISDAGFVDEGPDLRETAILDGRKGGRDHITWEIKCGLP